MTLIIAALPDARLRAAFDRVMAHSSWTVQYVSSVSEVAGVVSAAEPTILVVQASAFGQSWRGLLDSRIPVVVIASEPSERLWAEVLTLDGCDVLVEPLDAREVFRVLSAAWHLGARTPPVTRWRAVRKAS